MLKIYFGSHKDEIYNTDLYFNNSYKDKWFSDNFVKRMIKEIDNSEVIDNNIIKNDILGTFSPINLSTGVKTLILIYSNPKMIFNISNCGDNCIPLLFEITNNKDITVCLHHFLSLPENKSVKVINDNKRKIISDPMEFLLLANEYLRK